MSRVEGKIGDQTGEQVDASDILAALAGNAEADAKRRQDAVSRYLSASEGWREASGELRGAFAKDGTWLKPEKEQ